MRRDATEPEPRLVSAKQSAIAKSRFNRYGNQQRQFFLDRERIHYLPFVNFGPGDQRAFCVSQVYRDPRAGILEAQAAAHLVIGTRIRENTAHAIYRRRREKTNSILCESAYQFIPQSVREMFEALGFG